MTASAKQQEFHDDGTPKRRYELGEQENGKVGLRIAAAVVMANALVLVKSVLFWNEVAAEPGGGSPPQSSNGKPVGDTIAEMHVADAPAPDQPDDELPDEDIAASTAMHLIAARNAIFTDEPPEDLRRHSSGRPASNDNEVLYGATPGAAIDLSNPSGGPSASGNGQGGSDSGSGDPGHADDDRDEGLGDGYDEEDDEDDDDDGPTRPNRLPVLAAPVILADLYANDSTVVLLSDLLQNASDPDGDVLRIRNLSVSSGELVRRDDTSWLFTPERNDTSHATFTYEVSDGKGGVPQVATLDLVSRGPGHIEGTPREDTLIGTPRDDVIVALAGDDTILAREGDDLIYGGSGNDRIVAGDGDDVVFADQGNDVVYAGAGDDTVFGGEGSDVIFGEAGRDALFGEDGDDVVSGGEDADTIAGNAGDDKLQGDAGDDAIDGGAGSDYIDGGSGDDTIQAGTGNDEAVGGDGNDVFIAFAGDGNDAYNGGSGSDTYDASGSALGVRIDLIAGTASGFEIGDDSIDHFENARGGAGDDVFIADQGMNIFSGGDGADLFVFGSTGAAGLGAGARDKILDFAVGDRIDLDDISAEFSAAIDEGFEDHGIRKFVLISQGLPFSQPGQLKFKYDEQDEVTILAGNIDYEGDVDFELEIAGLYEFRDDDFHWRS